MDNKTITERVAQYIAEHAQYVGHDKIRALAGYYKTPAEREAALVKAGFTFEIKNGHPALTNAVVSPEWRTGGVTGGSCWGGVADQPMDGEEMPAWLEDFVERLAPEISFLKFRKLQQRCTSHNYSSSDYYANCTHYTFQVLKVSDILEVLGA
jgi:hypothetical protein